MEAALVSGVLLCLIPDTFVTLSRANLISEEGRCKTFDAAADGYVRGEVCRSLYFQPAIMPESDVGLSSTTAVPPQQRM